MVEAPVPVIHRLESEGDGHHTLVRNDLPPGTLYWFRDPDGHLRPDPASRSQPQGVHGPSRVVELPPPSLPEGWGPSIPWEDWVIQEIHVGTFTPEGTLDAAVGPLSGLRSIGINAVELMPVHQFAGARNWGYDAVGLWAVQNTYGGPEGLRRFVEGAHASGMAVILDVIYNHVGPEGNYLAELGPYFSDRYRVPWGQTWNLDGPDSDAVREYLVENAGYWASAFGVDALRLDAVHALFDMSPVHIVAEIGQRLRRDPATRRCRVIAESDLNDPRVVRPPARGGWGCDAQWADDFHHALHAVLTGEKGGYYQDFGKLASLARAHRTPFVYAGQYSAYRRRRHGASARGLPPHRFVVCGQNHDQVGNRPAGDRWAGHLDPELVKVGLGLVLLSPYIPLVFMGEEYGEENPFLFFTDFSDPAVVAATRKGREEELRAWGSPGPFPDPQDPRTFEKSRLDRSRAQGPSGLQRQAYVRELLDLRRRGGPTFRRYPQSVRASERSRILTIRRPYSSGWIWEIAALTFGPKELRLPGLRESFDCLLDSRESRWGGPSPSEPPSLGASPDTLRVVGPGLWLIQPSREGVR